MTDLHTRTAREAPLELAAFLSRCVSLGQAAASIALAWLVLGLVQGESDLGTRALLFLVAIVLTSLVFLAWSWRAWANLWELGAGDQPLGPSWGLLGYLIPCVNGVAPLFIVWRLWGSSAPLPPGTRSWRDRDWHPAELVALLTLFGLTVVPSASLNVLPATLEHGRYGRQLSPEAFPLLGGVVVLNVASNAAWAAYVSRVTTRQRERFLQLLREEEAAQRRAAERGAPPRSRVAESGADAAPAGPSSAAASERLGGRRVPDAPPGAVGAPVGDPPETAPTKVPVVDDARFGVVKRSTGDAGGGALRGKLALVVVAILAAVAIGGLIRARSEGGPTDGATASVELAPALVDRRPNLDTVVSRAGGIELPAGASWTGLEGRWQLRALGDGRVFGVSEQDPPQVARLDLEGPICTTAVLGTGTPRAAFAGDVVWVLVREAGGSARLLAFQPPDLQPAHAYELAEGGDSIAAHPDGGVTWTSVADSSRLLFRLDARSQTPRRVRLPGQPGARSGLEWEDAGHFRCDGARYAWNGDEVVREQAQAPAPAIARRAGPVEAPDGSLSAELREGRGDLEALIIWKSGGAWTTSWAGLRLDEGRPRVEAFLPEQDLLLAHAKVRDRTLLVVLRYERPDEGH